MKALVAANPYTLVVKNSRFLAEILPANSQEDARALLATQRANYPDASHVVHALAIGPTAGVLGCSDDGEPPGTAGRPVLEVLKGSGLTNVLLTVTRWFGGTKLGTGGLVKAYGDAAKGVLENATTREIVPMARLAFTLPYPILEPARRLLKDHAFAIQEESYSAAGDAIRGEIPASQVEELSRLLADLSRGQIIIECG